MSILPVGICLKEVASLLCIAEHVEVASAIMISAVLLWDVDYLTAYGRHIAGILEKLIGHLGEKGMKIILAVMDVLLQAFPQLAPALLQGSLHALLSDLLSGQEPGQVVAGKSFCI